jgi:ABC-2 type transport system permease protein/ribosome-dependent ATPase
MNLKRVSAIVSKEWREILRDRLSFSLAFIMPVLWMWVFAFGLSLDVENIPFVVVDYDRSALSRDYAHSFIDSRYFDFRGFAPNERELGPLLADSRIRFALIIPEHFQKRFLAGRPMAMQSLIDGTFPFRAQTTKGYVIAINNAVGGEFLARYLAHQQGIPLSQAEAAVRPLRLEVRYLYNQEVRSIWSLAPALIMFALMVSSPLLTALGVVREKESGAIYNIYASTVSRAEFLVGKLLPRVVISAINVLILWLMATGLFAAPFKGNFCFFFAVSLLYVVCTTGIGLLVSLLVTTQATALIVTVVLTVVPTILFSGMLVPVSSLGDIAQLEAHLFPAMYYNNIALGTFLKGVGLEVLWLDVLALAAYSAALFAVSYLLFHKRPAV